MILVVNVGRGDFGTGLDLHYNMVEPYVSALSKRRLLISQTSRRREDRGHICHRKRRCFKASVWLVRLVLTDGSMKTFMIPCLLSTIAS